MKLYTSRKKRLLAIEDLEKLSELNIYYRATYLFFCMIFRKRPEEKYIVAIKVSYKDGSHKYFDIPYWIAFKEGILKNLYYKGLCKIKFITYHKPYGNKAEFEKRFGKVDPGILIAAQQVEKFKKKKASYSVK